MPGNSDAGDTGNGAQWRGGKFRHHPPEKCPFRGDLNPHLIHSSSGPPESSSQTASRAVRPFCRAQGRCFCVTLNFPNEKESRMSMANRRKGRQVTGSRRGEREVEEDVLEEINTQIILYRQAPLTAVVSGSRLSGSSYTTTANWQCRIYRCRGLMFDTYVGTDIPGP